MIVRVYFWKDLAPLLRRFCKEHNIPFNRVINLAVQSFIGTSNVEELKLRTTLSQLLREEAELRRVCNAMLRSGSYLPGYVQRVLREPGRSLKHLPDPQRPLKALNPREEHVFRKIAARREQIAREIVEIQEQLLRDVRPFRLKPDLHGRSQSRARGKISLKEVKNPDGETA
ncbi:MAG: hypothetical protein QXM65_08310 [Candidatus Bathyarchaeia archaeon]